MTRIKVAAVDDLWAGEMRGVQVAGESVVLINLDGRIVAYRDRCAHLGIKLSEGTLAGCVLTCRAHHWQYDVTTGSGVNPAPARLVPVKVEVDGDDVFVVLPAPEVSDVG